MSCITYKFWDFKYSLISLWRLLEFLPLAWGEGVNVTCSMVWAVWFMSHILIIWELPEGPFLGPTLGPQKWTLLAVYLASISALRPPVFFPNRIQIV